MRDNYGLMRQAAQRRFLAYDFRELGQKPGVTEEKEWFSTVFLGETVRISKKTGECSFGGRPGNFGETLTVLDWLCDGRADALPSYRFCPVTHLTRAYTSGGGLNMSRPALAERIDRAPEAFCRACASLGGKAVATGDLGIQLEALPNLPLQLQFYHSDEEFPPVLTLLWDENTLSFIRYETVYYLAGCLLESVERGMERLCGSGRAGGFAGK